jgi:hypothetical protein
MTTSHVLLAVLLCGYSTIAVLSARAVIRERLWRKTRQGRAANARRPPSGSE